MSSSDSEIEMEKNEKSIITLLDKNRKGVKLMNKKDPQYRIHYLTIQELFNDEQININTWTYQRKMYLERIDLFKEILDKEGNLPNIFVLVHVLDNDIVYMIDGHHRYTVIKEYLQKQPKFDMKIQVNVFEVKTEERIPTIFHAIDKKKKIVVKNKGISKTIPPKLKELVWKTYIGNSISTLCPICEISEITSFSFECGHVLSRFNKGTNDIENLRAICKSCNSSMGSKHMYEYTSEFYPNSPMCKSFKCDDEQKKMEGPKVVISEIKEPIQNNGILDKVLDCALKFAIEYTKICEDNNKSNNQEQINETLNSGIDNNKFCYILPNDKCSSSSCLLIHKIVCPEYISTFCCKNKSNCTYEHINACIKYGRHGNCFNKNNCNNAHVNNICRFYIRKSCKSLPGKCKYKHIFIKTN